MRWYRLWCIDCKASLSASLETFYREHRVEVAGGVLEAWDKAKRDGYWPLHVIESDWSEQPATENLTCVIHK
jgi:hypothetical protein